MSIKMTAQTLAFSKANGLEDLFVQFADYWNNYRSLNSLVPKGKTLEFATVDAEGNPISFDEKNDRMHKALVKSIIARSNVNYAAESDVSLWFNHPNVVHETFAIVAQLIDFILPQTIIDSIGVYTDVRVGGWGDSFAFEIKPRDIFAVSRAGRNQRTAEMRKQFSGQVTVIPENHEISVVVSLYKVLSGAESLAEFTAKAVRSIETRMTLDAYNLFNTTMAAVDSTATTGLLVAGYTAASLLRICQQVEAWSQGARPVVMGTAVALLSVLPDDANYRYDLESDYVKMGYVRTMHGYDLMQLPQVADYTTPFGRVIADDRVWIVAPSSDKIVKLCIEGNTISNTTGTFDNADLSQSTTFLKSWNVGVATNAVAGIITL